MPPQKVTVRPVRASDAAELHDNCFSMNTLEQVEARLADSLRLYEQGNGIRLVAEVDGRVVGTVMLTRHTHALFAHRAQLDDVVVHGDYRRRGIARRLVAESCAQARALGIEILEVSCRAGTEAEQVYPRLGFVEYGRLPRGIVEPWNEGAGYDQVFYYQAVAPAP